MGEHAEDRAAIDVAIVVATLTIAAIGRDAASGQTEMRLIELRADRRIVFVDVEDDGSGPGDFALIDRDRCWMRPRKRAWERSTGTAWSSTRVEGKRLWRCSALLRLEDGQLMLEGLDLEGPGESAFAVLGEPGRTATRARTPNADGYRDRDRDRDASRELRSVRPNASRRVTWGSAAPPKEEVEHREHRRGATGPPDRTAGAAGSGVIHGPLVAPEPERVPMPLEPAECVPDERATPGRRCLVPRAPDRLARLGALGSAGPPSVTSGRELPTTLGAVGADASGLRT